MGVKHPDVKVCSLKSTSPHTICRNIKACTILCIAVAPVKPSSVTGCSTGSMRTSLQTSVRRVAVRSRISLCLMDGKTPLAHDSACSTEKLLPHSHFAGRFDGVQP